MRKQAFVQGMKSFWVVLSLTLAGSTLAANVSGPDDAELDEVLVDGRKPETEPKKILAWLTRLIGEFRYEGSAESFSSAGSLESRAAVDGGAQCLRISTAPAVQCLMNVTWPEMLGRTGEQLPSGVSTLAPAVAVYGLDLDRLELVHMQVDSRGLAQYGRGQLIGDILISRAPCGELPGNCQRVVRIDAAPDGKVVKVRIDIERDGKRAVRYSFQWIRLRQGEEFKPVAPPRPAPVSAMSSAAVGSPSVENWLRRMMGRFVIEAPDLRRNPPSLDRSGRAECLGIGAGPGIRCVFFLDWPQSQQSAKRVAAYTPLVPTFQLWGFDPAEQQVVIANVWPSWKNMGTVHFETAYIERDKLIYKKYCDRPSCDDSIVRWSIRSDGVLEQQRMNDSWAARLIPEREGQAGTKSEGPVRQAPNTSPRR